MSNATRPYSDLELIDELLVDLRTELNVSWDALERHSSVTYAAIRRLREAYASGEMSVISLGLARYLEEKS